ncbi:MAG: hypothetical protein GY841_13565 [FCB group bacterium]|nr:hypothetical protein [FCB group bacterium]
MPKYKIHLGENLSGRYIETKYKGYGPVSVSADDFETCEESVLNNIRVIHFPTCEEGPVYLTHYGLSENGFIVEWFPLTNKNLQIGEEDKLRFKKGDLRLPAFIFGREIIEDNALEESEKEEKQNEFWRSN